MPEMIELAGLIYKTERGYVDRFRGRVIFPICDHHGETIALAGRILPQFDTGKVGKYVNSPETPIYHKGSSLYGIHITKSDMKRADMAVVVEGEMDLLSAWQAGVTNVVAIKGSAFTEGQLTVLSRYVRQTTLALDSDFAGSNAALKGIFLAEKMGMTVKVVKLANYKDPDEFAKADPKKFIIAVREAVAVWDFIIEFTLSKFDVSTGEGVRNVSREVMPLLAQIEDKVVQARYVQYLAMRLRVPPEAVVSQLEATGQHSLSKTQSLGVYKPEVLDRREMLERRLFAALLLSKIDKSSEILLDNPTLKAIYEQFVPWKENNTDKPLSEFALTLSEVDAKLLSDIILSQEDDILETSLLTKELSQIVLREKLAAASDEIAAAEREDNEEALTRALNKHRDLTAKLAQFTASS
jgi:DNA primase